jgi:hypothetical protein
MEGSMSESTFGSEPGESRFGADSESEERESSYSSDVRAGYDDDDKPPERGGAEVSEDEVDSAAADVAAGYEDDDLEDD